MFGTYLRLNISVHEDWRTVVRAAARKLSPGVAQDRALRSERHRFYRQMLAYHRSAQRLVHEGRL